MWQMWHYKFRRLSIKGKYIMWQDKGINSTMDWQRDGLYHQWYFRGTHCDPCTEPVCCGSTYCDLRTCIQSGSAQRLGTENWGETMGEISFREFKGGQRSKGQGSRATKTLNLPQTCDLYPNCKHLKGTVPFLPKGAGVSFVAWVSYFISTKLKSG